VVSADLESGRVAPGTAVANVDVVAPVADLSVGAYAEGGYLLAHNDGPHRATQIVLDVEEHDVKWNNIQTPGSDNACATYQITGRNLSCNIASIDPGHTKGLRLNLDSGSASVKSQASDPDLSNNFLDGIHLQVEIDDKYASHGCSSSGHTVDVSWLVAIVALLLRGMVRQGNKRAKRRA